ncbi:tetratricopeptide repeat protein, partial [Vibrio parahaemolyticus]|nr:tetratricopeptide repeat protein [Vibrio parahaemolyticus]
NVGYFLILQGKPDEAIPNLQQAIDKNPAYYELSNKNLERALAIVRERQVISKVFLLYGKETRGDLFILWRYLSVFIF